MARTMYGADTYPAAGTRKDPALRAAGEESRAAVLVRLGNSLMSEALTGLMQARGWRCGTDAGACEPEALIVDAATIGENLRLRYPRSRVLFLQMDGGSPGENALLAWHGADAVVPGTCTVAALEKILRASRAGRPAREGLPRPFTPQERRVIQGICRGERTKEISGELQISVHSVKVYVHSILAKTRAPNRTGLITLFSACARREDHGA